MIYWLQIMLGLNILSSLLLGSSLSLILTKFLLARFNINFYTSELAIELLGTNNDLALSQTFDLIALLLFVGFSITIFIFNYYAAKRGEHRKNWPLSIFYTIASFLVFLQAHFVVHSGARTVVLVAILQTIFFLLSNKKIVIKEIDSKLIINGLLAGYYLLILTNLLTASFTIPLILFISLPILYVSTKKLPILRKSSFHLLFILASFFPFSKVALLLIAALFLILTFLFKNKAGKFIKKIEFVYPYAVLFIFAYNPIFYLGTFDTIEEGLWLGWAQRLLNGEVLYRDFQAYHPPLFNWGLVAFLRLTKISIYHSRLFFHSLQVIGVMIIYHIVARLIQSRLLKILTMALILAFLTIHVRNNVEIRLGLGLLAVAGIFAYIKSSKPRYLIGAGVATAASFFASTEVGVVTLVSSVISIFLITKQLKRSAFVAYKQYLLGVIALSLPIILVLLFKGAFTQYLVQMQYILALFSNGYSNAAITRPELGNILQWREVDSFFSSTAWFWEVAVMGIVGALMYAIFRFLEKRLTKKDVSATVLTIFSLLLFRIVLGRSDKFHLLTVLVPALILITYLLESLSRKTKYLGVFLLIFMAAYFARGEVNQNFLQQQFAKFQTYANPSGEYPTYTTERMGILALPGTDTATEDSLISYIKRETGENESIFVFPQKAELYFLTETQNATSYDTPIIYLTSTHQKKMVEELARNKPKLVVYNPNIGYYDITVEDLSLVNEYITQNYQGEETFGDWQVLKPK